MELKYRPEIDGLRTIAVLAVIIYHAEIFFGNNQLLKGGFFGVDVFFVISGFLITSIIMSEYHRTGKFSITNFYERRARRILPALFVVILVSLPFAWNLLLPSQLVDYAKSILSALAFGSNFYWDSTLQEYGAESALLKPFLHTWTLAVEEQYYIIFPLILLAIYKWAKSHTIVILTATFLLSLQLAQVMTGVDASSSFYMLPTRFWELLAGSLLANILYLHPQQDNDALLNRTMPILGLYLIVYSMVFIDFDAHHPGFVTLLPVIGTVLIIWFANENDLVTRVLSNKLFVAIGLISYSLYLWHYPIFAFGRMMDMEPTWHDKVLWISLTFILSIASYFIIEKPARNKILINRKLFMALIMFVGLLTVAVLLLFIQQSSTQTKGADSGFEIKRERNSSFEWDKHGFSVCHRDSQNRSCGPLDNVEKNILVVGDSMTPDATRILATLYPENHYIMSWEGGCPPIRKVEKNFRSSERKEACKKLNEQRFSSDYTKDIDGIVIITLSAPPEIDHYISHLKSQAQGDILIFGNYLNIKRDMSDLLMKYQSVEKVTEVIKSQKLIVNRVSKESMFNSLSKKYGIEYLSIRDYACDNYRECIIFLGDAPYSWDKHHFSFEFTNFLVEEMRQDIANTWIGRHSK